MDTKAPFPEPDGQLAIADWKGLVEDDKKPESSCIRKFYESKAEHAPNGDDRTIDFVISTISVDRDRDIVFPKGGDWTAFLKNGPGPVPFGHDYRSLPVAFSPLITATDLAVVARAVFPTKDELGIPESESSMGETVFRMVKGKLGLKNASIGFNPKKFSFNRDRGGMDFEQWEGLEWSIVVVPANQDAVAQLGAKGVDMAPIWYWARKALDTAEDVSAIETAKLEALIKYIGHPKGMSLFDLSADEMTKDLESQVITLDLSNVYDNAQTDGTGDVTWTVGDDHMKSGDGAGVHDAHFMAELKEEIAELRSDVAKQKEESDAIKAKGKQEEFVKELHRRLAEQAGESVEAAIISHTGALPQ